MEPATRLPWSHNGGRAVYSDGALAEVNGPISEAKQDAAYITHAANAYPKLVQAVRVMIERSVHISRSGGIPALDDMRYAEEAATALLHELGEAE